MMARINGINSVYLGKNSNNLYTKRAPLDTSELYIKSSLNQIYNRTVADCFVKEKLGNIKDFVDRNLKLA